MFTPEGGLNEEVFLAMQIERELETEDLVVLGRLRKALREAKKAEAAHDAVRAGKARAVRLAPGS